MTFPNILIECPVVEWSPKELHEGLPSQIRSRKHLAEHQHSVVALDNSGFRYLAKSYLATHLARHQPALKRQGSELLHPWIQIGKRSSNRKEKTNELK